MIKIYCLIDPATCHPFYVGVTKLSLEVRLRKHILDAEFDWNHSRTDRLRHVKSHHINRMIRSGYSPVINLLFTTDRHCIEYYEKFFYDTFLKQGFVLMQDARRFNYYKNQYKRLIKEKITNPSFLIENYKHL